MRLRADATQLRKRWLEQAALPPRPLRLVGSGDGGHLCLGEAKYLATDVQKWVHAPKHKHQSVLNARIIYAKRR